MILLFILLTAVLSISTPAHAGKLASDDFNRANGSIGSNWTTGTSRGFYSVSSNTVIPNAIGSDTVNYWNGVQPPANQYAQAKVTPTGGAADGYTGPGVALRVSTSQATYYQIVVNANVASRNVSVSKFVNNSWSGLCPTNCFTSAWNAGDTLRAEVRTSGTSAVIRVFRNGTQVGTDITDSSPIASGYAGIVYSSTITAAVLDDFEMGALGKTGLMEPFQ